MNFSIRFNPMPNTYHRTPHPPLEPSTPKFPKLTKMVASVILLMSILFMRYFVKKKKIIWCEWLYYFLVLQAKVFASY
jgi:hypothetical protein